MGTDKCGYALCIYCWVDGWLLGEEFWIAEHYTSRCHESILSHSPVELNLLTTFSPLGSSLNCKKCTLYQNNICKTPIFPFSNGSRTAVEKSNYTQQRRFKDIYFMFWYYKSWLLSSERNNKGLGCFNLQKV